jgi:hypothetical protein
MLRVTDAYTGSQRALEIIEAQDAEKAKYTLYPPAYPAVLRRGPLVLNPDFNFFDLKSTVEFGHTKVNFWLDPHTLWTEKELKEMEDRFATQPGNNIVQIRDVLYHCDGYEFVANALRFLNAYMYPDHVAYIYRNDKDEVETQMHNFFANHDTSRAFREMFIKRLIRNTPIEASGRTVYPVVHISIPMVRDAIMYACCQLLHHDQNYVIINPFEMGCPASRLTNHQMHTFLSAMHSYLPEDEPGILHYYLFNETYRDPISGKEAVGGQVNSDSLMYIAYQHFRPDIGDRFPSPVTPTGCRVCLDATEQEALLPTVKYINRPYIAPLKKRSETTLLSFYAREPDTVESESQSDKVFLYDPIAS